MEQGLAVVSHLLMTVHTWCQEEFIFHAKKQAIKPTADWKYITEFPDIVKTATMAKFKPPDSWIVVQRLMLCH